MRNPPPRTAEPTVTLPPIKRTPTPGKDKPWYMLPNGRGSSMPYKP